MIRATGNLYARFTDIFDQPEEPRAVFSSHGKIEFVTPDGELDSKPQKTNGHDAPTMKPRKVSANKKAIAFIVLSAVVFILIVLTLTNLIIVLQDRQRVWENSDAIAGLPHSLRMDPKVLNFSIQAVLANWSDHVISRLSDELRISPTGLNTAVQKGISDWSDSNLPQIKEQLRVRPDEIDSSVEKAVSAMKSSIVTQLKDELQMKPEEIDSKIRSTLSNWTAELRARQDDLDVRIRNGLLTNSRDAVMMLKEQLATDPGLINQTVNNILTNWSGGALTHLSDMISNPNDGVKAVQEALRNMNEQLLQRVRVELGIVPLLFQKKVEESLANLTETVLQRLKDELQISPLQLEAGIKRAMANMSVRALAMIRGICEIAYHDKCYWAVKTGAIMFNQAASLCHHHGAEAANIYNDEHRQKLLPYLRSKMGSLKTIWLGMTRNLTAGVTYLENGDISNYTMPWFPNYPLNNTGFIHIGLHFEPDPAAVKQGFFNDFTFNKRHGILCEL